MFRPQPISSTDARKYFTKLINKVSFSSKSFVIQSYRQPLVRIVNENYIRALEDVVGKKTVGQVMEIAGNERLLEAEKIEEIKKVFQRRLSGTQRPESRPERPRVSEANRGRVEGRPQESPQKKQNVKVAARHVYPEPNGSGAAPTTPKPQKPHNPQVILLSNGKNYQ